MVNNRINDILESIKWEIESSNSEIVQKAKIYYFSLTTCVYCKKGMKWLKERGINFKWVYLDNFAQEKRQEIKKIIQENYQMTSRMASPFVIFRFPDRDYISNGYDPEYWKTKIR